MRTYKEMMLSRRTLLRTTAVATGYLLVSEAYAPPGTKGAQPGVNARSIADRLTLTTSKFFSGEWQQERIAKFPIRYVLPPRNETCVVSLRWDERLFRLPDYAFAVVGGLTRKLVVNTTAPGTTVIDIPPSVMQLVFRVEVINTYPNDNIEDAVPTSLTLTSKDGAVLDEWMDSFATQTCEAWSIETIVNWVCVGGFVIPARTSIMSIGPFDAPPGLAFEASYADILQRGPTLVSSSDPAEADSLHSANLESSAMNSLRQDRLSLTDALPPGSRLELQFEELASDSKPQPFGAHVPRLLMVPSSSHVGLRMSGMHESFPVSASGTQLSSYLPTPTA